MATMHEVIAQDGTCLYRGRDVELACEVYDAAPVESHLLCRQVWTPEDGVSAADAPVPYALTVAGYAATRRDSTLDASDGDAHDAAPDPVEASVPYALTDRAAGVFVVDTTNVVELRRRCPELFAPRPGGAA